MTTQTISLKHQLLALLESFPEDTLREVVTFVEFLNFRRQTQTHVQTPYVPITLGGLWQGITLQDEDVAAVRREMWQNFGERGL
ncbi:hypothetical protein [Candidatus Amarolinea dominans]|uniref:hypothetical protein n=1 Tax=Candidatus Amarolinea dominans TaxID=3140696 RepID=UPI001DA70994|nr:hypothetical protein [Anaerolineae bacterium]